MSFATPWKNPFKTPLRSTENTHSGGNRDESKKLSKAESSKVDEDSKENQSLEKSKPNKSSSEEEISETKSNNHRPLPSKGAMNVRSLSDAEYDELFKKVLAQVNNLEKNDVVDIDGPSTSKNLPSAPVEAPLQSKPSSQPGPSHAPMPTTPTMPDAAPEPECARQRITPANTFLAPAVRKRIENAPKKRRVVREAVDGGHLVRKIDFGRDEDEEKEDEENEVGERKSQKMEKDDEKKVKKTDDGKNGKTADDDKKKPKRRRILSPAESTPALRLPGSQSQALGSQSQALGSQSQLLGSQSLRRMSASQIVTAQLSSAIQNSPPEGLSRLERLQWLQRRRQVGTWVRCDKKACDKWRYLPHVNDPVVLPPVWYCKMHPDPALSHCDAEEVGPTLVEEEDLIHNLYSAGSVVWARLEGYPWWPAMVDDCPDTEQFYWCNEYSDIPTHYNVTFFDDGAVTRAWMAPGSLRPFTGKQLSRHSHGNIDGKNYSSRLEVAQKQAKEALPLTIGQRLKKYSFLTRYQGKIGELEHVKTKKASRKPKRRRLLRTLSFSDNSDNENVGWRGKKKLMKKKATTQSSSLAKLMLNMEASDGDESRDDDAEIECKKLPNRKVTKKIVDSQSESEDDEETMVDSGKVKDAGKERDDRDDSNPENGPNQSEKPKPDIEPKESSDEEEIDSPHNQSGDLFSEIDEADMDGIERIIDNLAEESETNHKTSEMTDMTRLATAGTSASQKGTVEGTQFEYITVKGDGELSSLGIIPATVDTANAAESSTLGFVSETPNVIKEATNAFRLPMTPFGIPSLNITNESVTQESLDGTQNLFSQSSVGSRLPLLSPMIAASEPRFITSTPNSSFVNASENAVVPDVDDEQSLYADNAGLFEAIVPEMNMFDELNISNVDSQGSDAFDFDMEE